MRITSAAFLLVAAMGWCASAQPVWSSENVPAGIDLTLRLGQPSSSQPGVSSDDSVTGSSQGHVSSFPPNVHSSGLVPQTHYEGIVDEGTSTRTGWRRVHPADSVLQTQVRLRRTWNKYVREHLDQPVAPIIQDGIFSRRNALRFQTRWQRLRLAKSLMLRVDGGHAYTASELALMRKRFKDWGRIAERLTPATGSVPASHEFEVLASEDVALLHRLEDILRRQVPHMIPRAP